MSSARDFGRGTGTRSHIPSRHVPDSTTSAFSTTSYDSHSEDGRIRDTTYSDREARDRTYSGTQRDVTFNSKPDVTSNSRDTSTDTERHGSYDFYYPPFEKTEWSCGETGGWQKLSFLLLVITFIGHAIAVCTPYWVMGFQGDQMTLYEGVWMSCYKEKGFGTWVCSTYDTIRNLFEQPVWYEAAQICAVLSVVLLMPALVAATLYSYVVALSGRARASWLFVAFIGSAAFCSFLSWVLFAAGYPTDQKFPPGSVRFHISFALQIISFFIALGCLASHLRDSYNAGLGVWDSNKGSRQAGRGGFGGGGGFGNSVARGRGVSATKTSAVPKLGNFSLPRFPSALSRFRSKGNEPSAPPPPPAPAAVFAAPPPRVFDSPDRSYEREPTAGRVASVPAYGSGGPSQRGPAVTNPTSYKSYAPSSDSMSGYDSQV